MFLGKVDFHVTQAGTIDNNREGFDKYGMRVVGGFYVDFWIGSETFRKGAVARLKVSYDNKDTLCDILIVEKLCSESKVDHKIKTHYWSFVVIGLPLIDELGVFPAYLMNIRKMKLYIGKNFRTYNYNYILVYANNKEEAEILGLKTILKRLKSG